jgi:hypothetical protein
MSSHKYHHWTEMSESTSNFLRDALGFIPEKQENGADLKVGDHTVEVKAAREWNRSKCSDGDRRRGRFQLHGYELADFVCFVLILEDGTMQHRLMAYDAVAELFGKEASVNHSRVFDS